MLLLLHSMHTVHTLNVLSVWLSTTFKHLNTPKHTEADSYTHALMHTFESPACTNAGANSAGRAYERPPNACFGHKLTLFLSEWSSISSWVQIDPFSLVNGLHSWCAGHLPWERINSLWWPLSLTLRHQRFSHQIKSGIKRQFNHQMWLPVWDPDFKT